MIIFYLQKKRSKETSLKKSKLAMLNKSIKKAGDWGVERDGVTSFLDLPVNMAP